MHPRLWPATALACLAFALPRPALAQEPADLRDCLDTIHRQGMSEMAAAHISGIAGIRLGQSSLTFTPSGQNGRYYASFHSNACPVPGTHPDTLAVRQLRQSSARDAEMALLKPLADSDGSGFVSTIEASTFRMLFEFGALIDQLRQESGYSRDKALRASGLDAETFEHRLESYVAIQRQAAEAGVTGFPDLGGP